LRQTLNLLVIWETGSPQVGY